MRFMLIVRASKNSEAGVMPPMELIEQMGKFSEEMVQAGVLVGGEGLKPTSKGALVHFAPNRKPSVTDGPFAESKELIGGYWMIRVNSREEAIEWAMRSPMPHGPGQEATIEIREVFESEDFGQEIAAQENALRERISKEQ